MIKFITPKNDIITYNQNTVEVEEDFSPFREIIKKYDFSNFYFVPNDNDNEKISLGNTFHLQVNVKNVGTFHFIFKNDGFNREDILKQVSGLRELNVDNAESAKYKVEALIGAVKGYDPLFAVFKESPDTYYYSYQLELEVNHQFPLFVIKIQEDLRIDEFSIGADEFQETGNKPERKKKFTKISKDKLLKEIARNKFSLLLVFVSTVLLQVSMPLGILNVYAKNALYIFLFICGTIGLAMNVYCYVDYFKNRNMMNPIFWFSVISNVIGMGVGIGIFAIFYNISTKAEGTPGIGSFILIGTLITIIVVAATISIVYFIPRKNKLK